MAPRNVSTNELISNTPRPTRPGSISHNTLFTPGWFQSGLNRKLMPFLFKNGICTASCAAPPARTPPASAKTCFSGTLPIMGPNATIDRIIATFSRMGETAGAKKCRNEFSMPIASAARPTNTM
jgi:hypothetical protein